MLNRVDTAKTALQAKGRVVKGLDALLVGSRSLCREAHEQALRSPLAPLREPRGRGRPVRRTGPVRPLEDTTRPLARSVLG